MSETPRFTPAQLRAMGEKAEATGLLPGAWDMLQFAADEIARLHREWVSARMEIDRLHREWPNAAGDPERTP